MLLEFACRTGARFANIFHRPITACCVVIVTMTCAASEVDDALNVGNRLIRSISIHSTAVGWTAYARSLAADLITIGDCTNVLYNFDFVKT